MPRRNDIHRILVIGSGPIVIGQACEFDYSGTQACKALREEGFRVVLLNSNPATIMTDPETADRTYIEPITVESIERILAEEQRRGEPVDAVLPTLGGQTGLNVAVAAAEAGLFERCGVRMIGADRDAIHKAEDRTAFRDAMLRIGLDVPRSGIAHTMADAEAALKEIGLPAVLRPAYTLGGMGGGIARTPEQFRDIVQRGLAASRVSEVLIEECLTGWKEFELEVMRDRADNVVIICSIENLDPMGVHTGDSITIAPQQTLTDKEYQRMRDAAIRIIREIGVETGGSNIQFAVDPKTGRQVVIEMNPRVSRSSALASKATGYPIARIAAKLAIGYTLDELPNDITKKTPASFEPVIDYVVVKIPRFAFEKFPEADETLTTQMKSVGEAMAIGRTFKESLQKCIRSMEIRRAGLGLDANDKWLAAQIGAAETPATASRRGTAASADAGKAEQPETKKGTPRAGSRAAEPPGDWEESNASRWPIPESVLTQKLLIPSQGRLYYVRYAFKLGWPVDRVHELTYIDPWFLDNIRALCDFENELLAARRAARGRPTAAGAAAGADLIERARRWGYSDAQLRSALGEELFGECAGHTEIGYAAGQAAVHESGPDAVYRTVDTCAAEFEAVTPYYYSAHDRPFARVAVASAPNRATSAPADGDFGDDLRLSDRPRVAILGGGPNRIGQGIEFDYCCVHAVQAARDMGLEAVMVNSNPETVSTDYDTADLLFFEPLTLEDVLRLCHRLSGSTPGSSAAARGSLRGVIVQFGGQTPINLAKGLHDAGVPILGTSPEAIHLAEDREQFARVLRECYLKQPANGIAHDIESARRVAAEVGYPVLVRPSYVLGGRAMQKCNIEADLDRYMERALRATDRTVTVDRAHPILIDQFLDEAIEVDVDCVADFGGPNPAGGGGRCVVCGVMEHIEEAGIHSGDSSCVLPPYSLPPLIVDELIRQTEVLARRLSVCGLMNVQFAVKNNAVYVLEVNPRASRTVPFVSKATGVPWARIATRVMLGESLDEAMKRHGVADQPEPRHISVKSVVFPFNRFPGIDVALGPEMRSTGEAMGIDRSFPLAFAKAMEATGQGLPTEGTVLVSVNDTDKAAIVMIAHQLVQMGFRIVSTRKTRETLAANGIEALPVSKTQDAAGPYLIDMIRGRKLDLLINTPIHWGSATSEGHIRAAAVRMGIPLITTIAGARAAVSAIRALRRGPLGVQALQDYFAK